MKNIFKKELGRVFSDKKMIFSLFVLPLVLMIGIYGLMGVVLKEKVADVEEHVAKVYVQNAPEAVKTIISDSEYAKTAKVTYLEEDASKEEIQSVREKILDGEVDLLVTFGSGFMEKIAAYRNAGDVIPQVTLGFNSGASYSAAARSNFNEKVIAPLQTVLLQERFKNLDLLTVFQTSDDPIVKEGKEGSEMFAMMLPYMLTFMLFASAMSVCVDAIAGEKERGTMASMLLSPVKRTSIVYGKLFALSILSVLSSLMYAISTVVGMPLMTKGMGEEAASMNLSLSFLQGVELVVLMISLVLLYVAAICLVSVFAKNAKEASTYVMPLYMVIMIVSMMTMFNNSGVKIPMSTYAVPVYGTAVAIQGIISSEISLLQFGLNAGSNLLCTVLVVIGVAKVFNNEKVMLNA